MEPNQLGARIRQAREEKNLSQEQLAERISRDQRSVSEYESGKRRIYAHDLPTIAKALDVPIIYFYADVMTQVDIDESVSTLMESLPSDKHKTMLEILRLLQKLLDA